MDQCSSKDYTFYINTCFLHYQNISLASTRRTTTRNNEDSVKFAVSMPLLYEAENPSLKSETIMTDTHGSNKIYLRSDQKRVDKGNLLYIPYYISCFIVNICGNFLMRLRDMRMHYCHLVSIYTRFCFYKSQSWSQTSYKYATFIPNSFSLLSPH